MGLDKQIKNALVTSVSSLPFKTFVPGEYKDRQHEYFNHESRTFIQEYAKYSSDYVEAQIQGLNPEEAFEYTTVHIRFADVIKPSGALSNQFDSYKNIQIAERQYDYIRRGAKVIAMGNTWLVKNPGNMSTSGSAIIQRCDAVWNYLDYYGNVCSEPMCIDRDLMRANTPDSQRSTMITKGYFNAVIQYNEATKQLFQNSRMILGSNAYIITGFSDFIREFTDEEDSVNLLEFSLRYDEPNDASDDMVHHVAYGKRFAWDINIGGEATLTEGETSAYTASSVRTNAGESKEVQSTEEHPIDYIWTSDDETVATVDASGNVTAVSAGEVTITATLAQNDSISQTFVVTVASVDTAPHISFTGTYPDSLAYNRKITFEACYYENGEATGEPVQWSAEGADEEAYSFVISQSNVNMATLTCWGGSVTPVVVTATYGDYSVSHEVYLEGI